MKKLMHKYAGNRIYNYGTDILSEGTITVPSAVSGSSGMYSSTYKGVSAQSLQVLQQLLLVQKIQHTMHIILDLGKLNSIIKIVVFQQLVLQVVLVIVTKLLMVKLIAVLVVK